MIKWLLKLFFRRKVEQATDVVKDTAKDIEESMKRKGESD